MASRLNQLKGTKKLPLPSDFGERSKIKTQKINTKDIKDYMKKKIHDIVKFGGNMNSIKIIEELVKEGYKNNTKLQNYVKVCIKELIREKKIKVEGIGVVFASRYGKRSPSKLRKGQTANNISKEPQRRST